MADKLNDIVYTDDSKETVEVINLLLLGWILLGLIVYIIGTVIATQLRKRKAAFSSSKTEISEGKAEPTEHVSCASQVHFAAPEVFSEPEKLQKPFVIPVCSGDETEIVDWINSVFSWIYKNRVISPAIDAWVSALNARTRLLSTEHGILVDFQDISLTSGPPDIQEAEEMCTSRGELNIMCDVTVEDVQCDITVTQVKEKKTVTPFLLNVKRISGKVNIECAPEELTFTARYSEVPQIELYVEATKDISSSVESSQALNDVVCEICSEAFLSVIVELKLSCYPECPRLTLKNSVSEDETFESTESGTEEKLLVKIIKATNLGGNEGCLQPFCIVEMDEPPQKFETKSLEEKSNPFWDESFTFTVKDVSAELLFEIYDKGKPSKDNFLGLGIVSVDELIKNPSQRQIIPLQSRPLEDDNVSGSLTTEFLFLKPITPVTETAHLAQEFKASNGKTVETNSRVTAGGTVITTTTIKRTTEDGRGRPEATSNLIAIPIIFPPAHVIPEELVQKKNAQNACLTAIQDLNDTVNKKCASVEVSTNHINKCSNDPLLNETNIHLNKQNGFISAIENAEIHSEPDFTQNHNSLLVPETSLSNGDLGLACPILHVHDEHIISSVHPTSNVENENNTNGIEKTSIENSDTKLHEMGENVDSSNDFDLNNDEGLTLPSIPESVENSPTSSKSLENKDGEADLTGTALKELGKHSKPNSTSKSTLIIHSVQRVAVDPCGQWQEVQEPDSSVSESLEASPASHLSKDSRTSYSESVPSSPSQDRSGDDRSRSKEKKSILGSLRRRLSFRKTRSKSAENRSESSNYSQASSRSVSSDRIRSKGQKPSPLKGKFMGSTRSSLSEVSGISGSSSRTYINENSTLVVETNENGIIKRYLIPNSLIHRSKWKKRGIKLHIYNDHVFVAKHLSGSTPCQVCQKYLTRRPGKQGYECRGCNLQCHKSCHVKIENYCSNSSINSMEVEYIHDPKGATPKSI